MKVAAYLVLAGVAVATKVQSHAGSVGGPVAEVVILLKDMQKKSKADGEEEAKLWSTFAAYCTEQDAKKTKSIEDLSNNIASLENRIEELGALGRKLDFELGELEKDTKENKEQQEEAQNVRKNTAEKFEANKKDLEERSKSLDDAVTTLAKVQDPAKTAMLLQQLRKELPIYSYKATAFLQATGDDNPTNGVFGMLKSVLANTKTDLNDAVKAEDLSKANHDKLMETLASKAKTMELDTTSKQDALATSKTELATKQGELVNDKKTKADDEKFLAGLKDDCAKKAAINEERVALRKGEDEAIETAIEVLDGDRAAKFFAKSKAASGSFFLQTDASINRHDASRDDVMASVFSLLRTTAHESHSRRLAEVAVLAIPKNPFNRVLKAIVSMKAQIVEEEEVDKKQLDLCKKNRDKGAETDGLKKEQIGQIKNAMQTLDQTMYKEKDGLQDTIKSEEKELEDNEQDQRDQTKERREENRAYQTNIRNLQVAHDMLTQAVSVLKEYYASVKANKLNSFAQTESKDEEDPPKVADKKYAGQSESGGKVIGMIEGIMKETTEEEHLAHEAEGTAQRAFEDAMKLATDKEAALVKAIKDNKVALATTEQDYVDKEKELEATEKELQANTDFLAEIKPTCDFITTNYKTRQASRTMEDKALDTAAEKIKGSAAYKNAEKKIIR